MLGRTNGPGTINRLREEMDQLFDTFFRPSAGQWMPGTGYARSYPAVNLWEDDQNVYAEAEVPGLVMDDLEVYVVGNELTIKGERKEGPEQVYHRRERGIGRFERSIPLPLAIDSEKVQATLSHGVLSITMPKAEAAKPRRIEVRTA